LLQQSLAAADASWIGGEPPATASDPLAAKTRYRQADSACELRLEGSDAFALDFAAPQWAVTPGQSAVVYRGEECLGGRGDSLAWPRGGETTGASPSARTHALSFGSDCRHPSSGMRNSAQKSAHAQAMSARFMPVAADVGLVAQLAADGADRGVHLVQLARDPARILAARPRASSRGRR
jgi:hypothetical protein